jgi:hypothetical protein
VVNKRGGRDNKNSTVSSREPLRTLRVQLVGRASPLTSALVVALMLVLGCSEPLDAGSTRPHGLLPIDERNPIVLVNDGAEDNWQGEYAVLLANGGGPRLVGMVVEAGGPWPDIDANVTEWRSLIAAARQSGLQNLPDPIASVGESLVKPASGRIEDTVPNRSEGARLIVARAAELSLPYRPLVIATGSKLTDVADAYLLDPTVADKIIVVSSLGSLSSTGATMSNPNGEMDPWADQIVSTRLHYVQVSAYYDQLNDLTDARLADLPDNAFGAWMADKRSSIYSIDVAADQVSVLAAAVPAFVTTVSRVDAPGAVTTSGGPDLVAAQGGDGWLVTQSNGGVATARLWELLGDPGTFGN